MSKDYNFNLKKKKYGLLAIMVWLVKQLLKNLLDKKLNVLTVNKNELDLTEPKSNF